MAQCLVVKKEILEKTDFWQKIPKDRQGNLCGFLRLKPFQIKEFLKIVESHRQFKERHGLRGVEFRKEWQQIIFYGLIRQKDKFFVYQRGGKNSQYREKRLREKISVGLGGHIEPFDNNLIDSLYREFDEEIALKKGKRAINLKDKRGHVDQKSFANLAEIRILGLIKDETDEVGKVHLGLACEINLINPDLKVGLKGDENAKGEMMSFKKYQDLIKGKKVIPESWTKIFMKELFKED